MTAEVTSLRSAEDIRKDIRDLLYPQQTKSGFLSPLKNTLAHLTKETWLPKQAEQILQDWLHGSKKVDVDQKKFEAQVMLARSLVNEPESKVFFEKLVGLLRELYGYQLRAAAPANVSPVSIGKTKKPKRLFTESPTVVSAPQVEIPKTRGFDVDETTGELSVTDLTTGVSISPSPDGDDSPNSSSNSINLPSPPAAQSPRKQASDALDNQFKKKVIIEIDLMKNDLIAFYQNLNSSHANKTAFYSEKADPLLQTDMTNQSLEQLLQLKRDFADLHEKVFSANAELEVKVENIKKGVARISTLLEPSRHQTFQALVKAHDEMKDSFGSAIALYPVFYAFEETLKVADKTYVQLLNSEIALYADKVQQCSESTKKQLLELKNEFAASQYPFKAMLFDESLNGVFLKIDQEEKERVAALQLARRLLNTLEGFNFAIFRLSKADQRLLLSIKNNIQELDVLVNKKIHDDGDVQAINTILNNTSGSLSLLADPMERRVYGQPHARERNQPTRERIEAFCSLIDDAKKIPRSKSFFRRHSIVTGLLWGAGIAAAVILAAVGILLLAPILPFLAIPAAVIGTAIAAVGVALAVVAAAIKFAALATLATYVAVKAATAAMGLMTSFMAGGAVTSKATSKCTKSSTLIIRDKIPTLPEHLPSLTQRSPTIAKKVGDFFKRMNPFVTCMPEDADKLAPTSNNRKR